MTTQRPLNQKWTVPSDRVGNSIRRKLVEIAKFYKIYETFFLIKINFYIAVSLKISILN